MATLGGLVSKERLQYLVFIGLSLTVAAFTGILYFSNKDSFQTYFGSLNPLLVIFLLGLLGITLLTFLLTHGWFAIYKKHNLQRLFLTSSLAALFVLATILVDIKVVFPKDLNVPFPQSLLFYPAIGYVVEILFHLLPISFLLIILTALFKNADRKKILWVCILSVAVLEPIYQTIGFVGQYPLWTVGYVGLDVLLFNLVQLTIFERYDFISMFSFRLAYYLLWHIIWGYLRLKILF